MKKCKIVELFSGIGSQARALENLKIEYELQATCEWDIHAFVAYDAIHYNSQIIDDVKKLSKDEILKELANYTLSNDGKECMQFKSLQSYNTELLRRIFSAIKRTKNLVDISKVTGEKMPENTDILTYSFPCQDLSNVGAFHGYNKGIDKESGSRSSLLWQVGRILTEMREANKKLPRFLVLENVQTLLAKRHFSNFNMWIDELSELGYMSKYFKLNAHDFGIPQNRPRLLMISIYVGKDSKKKEIVQKYFDNTTPESIVDDYCESDFYKNIKIDDLLRIPTKKGTDLWKEAVECTPNDTPSRRKIWNENPKIMDKNGKITKETFIRTVTTKQDRHPNSGNIYFDCGIEGKGKFRYLTPRECLLFMGFTDKDYIHITENNPLRQSNRVFFPRDKIIRMAGNSIPVKLLEGFFYQFYKLEDLLN